jgi:hypothetical protein
MKAIISLFLLLSLVSCAVHKKASDCDNLEVIQQNNQVIPLELPNWFLTMPQERGVAIGIAATNNFKPEVTDSLVKENASIISNRNKSAIVIAKLKMREDQSILTPMIAKFNLQLANDIPELKRFYEKSKIIKKTEVLGMTIGLVGEENSVLNTPETTSISLETPAWYRENSYYTTDNYLISCGKSSAVNMATAYYNAYNEAVYNLIAGIRPDVQSKIINSNNYIEKFVEIDASLIIENMKNCRNSLVLRQSGNGYIYDAYVELKWQSKYILQDIKIKD